MKNLNNLSVLGLTNIVNKAFRSFASFPLLFNLLGSPKVGPTFTRSTTATLVDFEGVIKTAKINESRFTGARRVENLIPCSEINNYSGCWTNANGGTGSLPVITEDYDGEGVSRVQFDSGVGTDSQDLSYFYHTVSSTGTHYNQIKMKSTSGADQKILLYGLTTFGSEVEVTITSEWQTFTWTGDENIRVGLALRGSVSTVNTSDILVKEAQMEFVTGSQTEASEYVSTGVSVQTIGGELVTNGGFDSWDGTADPNNFPTDWLLKNADASNFVQDVSGGMRWVTQGAGSALEIEQSNILEVGKNYKITVVCSSHTSGQVEVRGASSTSQVIIDDTGTFTCFFVSTGDKIRFVRDTAAAADLTIESVSVKEELYHGANVDGVKYYSTDRSGVIISDSILKGYRCDKEATNLILQSEDFGTTWSNSWGGGVTLTTDDAISPDGTKTSDKITQVDDPGDGIVQSRTLLADTVYTISEYFKNIDSTQSRLWVYDNNASASLAFLNFDWIGGVPSTATSSGASNIKYEALYDGWYRVSYSFTTSAIVTTHNIILLPEASATATNSVYVWGASVELGAFPTSYIKTTTAQVTRTPDELCYDNTNNQLLPNSFSLIMSTTPAADGEDYETDNLRIFSSEDTAGGTSDIIRTSKGSYNYSPLTGGGIFFLLETDINIDTQGKYGFQLFQDGSDVDAKMFLNGVKERDEANTQTLTHSDTSICFGFWQDNYYTGNLKNLKIYDQTKSQLSEAKMIRLTT